MTTVRDVIQRLSRPPHDRYYMLTVNLRPVYELLAERIDGLTDELSRCIIQYANRKGWLYSRTSDDFALSSSTREMSPINVYVLDPRVMVIIIDMQPYSTFGVIADIKLEIIGRINRYFPTEMARVDQRRVFSTLDIGQSKAKGLERLQNIESYLVRREEADIGPALAPSEDEAAASGATGSGAPDCGILGAGHIQHLDTQLALLGPEGCFAALLSTQRMAYADADGRFRPFAREIHTNLNAIRRFFLPSVQSWGGQGDFDQMTAILDKFLLRALAAHDDSLSKPTSINLNVQSMLGEDFAKFQKHHGGAFRNLILEVRLHDVIANLDDYLKSRRMLAPEGVKFCIDWLDLRQLRLVNVGGIQTDLVKIPCSFDPKEGQERLKDIFALQAGGQTAVMMHIDSDDFVRVGRTMGFRIFQGRAVDRQLWRREGKGNGEHLAEIDGIRRDIIAWSSFLHYCGERRASECDGRAHADFQAALDKLRKLQDSVETADELRMINALIKRVTELDTALLAPRPGARQSRRTG